jgi:hypothetical protein
MTPLEYGYECRPFKETRYVEMGFLSSEYMDLKTMAEKLRSVSINREFFSQNMLIFLKGAMRKLCPTFAAFKSL